MCFRMHDSRFKILCDSGEEVCSVSFGSTFTPCPTSGLKIKWLLELIINSVCVHACRV